MSFLKNKNGDIVYVCGGEPKGGFSIASKKDVIKYCETNKRFYIANKDDIESYIGKGKVTDKTPLTSTEIKLQGFTYNKIKISATKQDQDGLTAIRLDINDGIYESTVFKLSNGSEIELNKDNLPEFAARFSQFRQKLFGQGGEK